MAPSFCSLCGNILDVSTSPKVTCDCCSTVNTNKSVSETTTSRSNNFPSRLRSRLVSQTQVLAAKDMENTRRIGRECPQCNAKEMTWSEAQLRGADEGSTIFYRCMDCGHREKEGN